MRICNLVFDSPHFHGQFTIRLIPFDDDDCPHNHHKVDDGDKTIITENVIDKPKKNMKAKMF